MKLIDNLSISEIARRTSRDRGTIADLLRSEDTARMRAELESEARETALQILRGNNETAANAWIKAIGTAAEAGNHKPARDLLITNRVIEDRPSGMGGVIVVVGTVNQPAGPDPFDGIDVTPKAGDQR